MSSSTQQGSNALLNVIKARRGNTAAVTTWASSLDDRALTRAGLTDELDMAADTWRRLVGATLHHWANGTAKPHEQLWVATRLPMLNEQEREGALRALLAAVPAPEQAAYVLASLSPASMERAIAWQRADTRNTSIDCGALALRTVATLGRKTPDWISRFDSFAGAGNAHEGSYWLPLDATSQPALTRFLTQVPLAGSDAQDTLKKLRQAVAAWDTLGPKVAAAYSEGVEPTLSDARVWRKTASAPAAADGTFAAIWVEAGAGGWGRYSEAVALLVKSNIVPRAPLPRHLYRQDGYVGAFLDRSDPVGMLLGELTDCCQHLGGAAQGCVYHGQANPHGGFFAVRDTNGRVIAQSWVWFNDEGLCFDNIEILEPDVGDQGFDKLAIRRSRIQRIYEQAAADLAPRFGSVTVGTGYTDRAICEDWVQTEGIPAAELVYTDARHQRLIAADPTAEGLYWDAEGTLHTKQGPLLRAVRSLHDGQAVTTITLAPGVALDAHLDLIADVTGMDAALVMAANGQQVAAWEGDPSAHLAISLGSDWQQVVAGIHSASRFNKIRLTPKPDLMFRDKPAGSWWFPYVLGLTATGMDMEAVAELSQTYDVPVQLLFGALAEGLTVAELQSASQFNVPAMELLKARESGVSLQDLVTSRQAGVSVHQVVLSKENGVSVDQLVAVLGSVYYRQAVDAWRQYGDDQDFNQRTLPSPNAPEGAAWSLSSIKAFAHLQDAGMRPAEIAAFATQNPRFVDSLPDMVNAAPSLADLQQVMGVLGLFCTGVKDWMAVKPVSRLATLAYTQGIDLLEQVCAAGVHPMELERASRKGLSLAGAARLVSINAGLAPASRLLGLGVSEAQVLDWVDRRVSLRGIFSALHNGASIESIEQAHASKVPLRLLAHANRKGVRVDDVQVLEAARATTPLDTLSDLLARGATTAEILALDSDGKLDKVHDAILAGQKHGFTYPDYKTLKNAGLARQDFRRAWNALARACGYDSSAVTASILQAQQVLPTQDPIYVAMMRHRKVSDARLVELEKTGLIDAIIAGFGKPASKHNPALSVAQCLALAAEGLDPGEVAKQLCYFTKAGDAVAVFIKARTTGQDQHVPLGYTADRAVLGMVGRFHLPIPKLLELLDLPSPWTQTLERMHRQLIKELGRPQKYKSYVEWDCATHAQRMRACDSVIEQVRATSQGPSAAEPTVPVPIALARGPRRPARLKVG